VRFHPVLDSIAGHDSIQVTDDSILAIRIQAIFSENIAVLGGLDGMASVREGEKHLFGVDAGTDALYAWDRVSLTRKWPVATIRLPVGLVVRDSLVIAFGMDGLMYRFTVTFDGTRPRERLPLRFEVVSVCNADNRIFVHGFDESPYAIHEVTPEGDIIASFARPYASGEELISQELGRGQIACGASQDMLVLSLERIPYVLAYSLDGRLRWIVRTPGFRQGVLREVDGSLAHGTMDGYVSVHQAIQLLGPYIIVQYRTWSDKDIRRRSVGELATIVIDGSTGHVLGTAAVKAPIIGSGRSGLVASTLGPDSAEVIMLVESK
jgi:hypothetical protein